jgi:hypothetical protein
MVRQLKEVKLYEYSLVTFPMNTEAMVMAAKHFGQLNTKQEFTQAIRAKAQELGISMQSLIEEALLNEAANDGKNDPAKSQSHIVAEIERVARLLTT